MIIRRLRQDRGWSQEDLAQISGVSVRTIQRIENGGRASLETLKCLAAVFETSIPELRKDAPMNDDTRKDPPVGPAPTGAEGAAQPQDAHRARGPAPGTAESGAGLSEEDRAALRYVRYLKRYEDWEDDWKDNYENDFPAARTPEERRIRRQVRRERGFYYNLFSFIAVLAVLLAVNLLVMPDTIWVIWVALAWGISLVFHGFDVFGRGALLGDEWERREVERRLARLSRRSGKA